MFEAVLVTGCGGDIAISIARTLREEGLAAKIAGVDIHDRHAGRLIYDEVGLVPRAGGHDYRRSLERFVRSCSAEVVIVQSEAELAVLSGYGERTIGGADLLMVNDEVLDVCLDKLATARFLEQNGFLFPWTSRVDQGPPVDLPCIVKHPKSQGSKSVHRVDFGQVDYYRRTAPECVWQELLLPDDQEYTCGVFRTATCETRSIVIRRELVGGLTGFGEVVENEVVTALLNQVADALRLEGCMNVQLRITERGPVIFEINPRLSSTVRFRHLLGFTDLAWWLSYLRSGTVPPYQSSAVGARFVRGATEYIL